MIRATGVTKRLAGRAVLDELTLHASENVLVVVGPSGGGKSTLLRCLGGFERIDAGALSVGGHDLTSVEPAVLRRDVGCVFQGLHLFPHLSVLQNLQLAPTVVAREPKAESERRARMWLERFGVSAKHAERPTALSGGEQQRVAIARALMMRPKVLLFDEPTSALDPIRTAELASTMLELAAEGLGIVVVTHSMGLARRLGGTLAVLDAGRVVESGPSATLLADPQRAVSRQFFGYPAPP